MIESAHSVLIVPYILNKITFKILQLKVYFFVASSKYFEVNVVSSTTGVFANLGL